MAQITLSINDRNYDVTCDDGQEDHLRKLADHLDAQVRELTGVIGQVGEGRLLVMASLVVADELFEAYKRLHAIKAGADPEDGPGDEAGPSPEDGPVDEVAAETLEACAQRIETIAARLGGA